MAKKRGGGGGGNSGGGGAEKKDGNSGGTDIEIVFKLNLHCDGCTKRIRKSILSFPGVRRVEFEGEWKAKIIADPNVKPSELLNRVVKKTNKEVEILSPQPKKDDKKDKSQKSDSDKPKIKEPPLTTVVLKVAWHCDGCGDRIYKSISAHEGVYEVSIDKEKDLVTVKGKMDSKKMVEELTAKLRKPVEIVPEKKEKSGRDDNKEEGSAKAKGGEIASKVEQFVTGSGCYYYKDELRQFVASFHGPQLFSDENANGCSIM